jgi:hypothetical protein
MAMPSLLALYWHNGFAVTWLFLSPHIHFFNQMKVSPNFWLIPASLHTRATPLMRYMYTVRSRSCLSQIHVIFYKVSKI